MEGNIITDVIDASASLKIEIKESVDAHVDEIVDVTVAKTCASLQNDDNEPVDINVDKVTVAVVTKTCPSPENDIIEPDDVHADNLTVAALTKTCASAENDINEDAGAQKYQPADVCVDCEFKEVNNDSSQEKHDLTMDRPVEQNGWFVEDLNNNRGDARPVDAGQKMLEAHIAAVLKQEKYNKIRRVVRLFGENGATLPEICSTYQVIYGHELDHLFMRELISKYYVLEIPNTGRVKDSEIYFESMLQLVDEQF